MVLSITTDSLKKVLFSHDKNKQRVYNICCNGKKTDLLLKKKKNTNKQKQKQKQNKTKQKSKTKLKQKNEKK